MVTGLHLYRVNFPDFDLSFPPFPSLLLDNRFLDITALPSVTAQLPFPVSPLPFFAITCGPEQALLKFREVGVVGNLKDTTAAGQKFTPGNGSSWGRKEGGKNFCGRRKYARSTYPILSHARYSNSILNVRASNEGTKVRAANKYGYQCYGLYSWLSLPPRNISFHELVSYWRDTKNYRG